MNSDEEALNMGYRILTPHSFHDTEHKMLSWECPTCGAVVTRHAWQKHERFHGRITVNWESRHFLHAGDL